MPAGGAAVAAGLGRAFGGALIFGLPMLMTNELWELGVSMDRLRLALLLVLGVPLLVGVSHRIGFEPSFGWREDLRDAAIALGVGLVAGTLILATFNLLGDDLSLDALVGRVAVQTVPAALGALLARSQFGSQPREEREAFSGYFGTLFMMLVGALFLGLNVAPTEEMVQIAWTMTPWHALGLVALTVATMHAFVYGHGTGDGQGPWWSLLLRFTLVGYALALAISLYVLWTFGRVDGVGGAPLLMATLVLAFPAALGAAAARLIL
ncbi:MAG TPA: TIGR02587 family membrane protein [Amaricoccus sp.]|jgi:putative integral membrane protein (TIGR02587 family)|nr:TIGR02587 family membrane protein [Amaricoccus sp.]